MWKLGDVVVYGSAGICCVDDIRDEKFGDEVKKYFILKPLFDDKNTFFVPAFNETLMAKIRPVLTKNEALSLIRSMPEIPPEWIDNDKFRQERYRTILESGKPEMVVGMLKALYSRRLQLLEKGKKLRNSDEIFMRSGERLIENECAHIFGITRYEVQSFIGKELSI